MGCWAYAACPVVCSSFVSKLRRRRLLPLQSPASLTGLLRLVLGNRTCKVFRKPGVSFRKPGVKRPEHLLVQQTAGAPICSTQPADEPRDETDRIPPEVSKRCVDCGYEKPLDDFKKSTSYPDGHADTCRACIAVIAAKRDNRELGYLAMSPQEAWAQARRCLKCGRLKELRDFSINRNQASGFDPYCRSCNGNRLFRENAPSDAPKRCIGCGMVKPASEFWVHPRNRDGRHSRCIACKGKLDDLRSEKLKSASVFLRRHQKVCIKCKEVKALPEFHKNSTSMDGHLNQCKSCIHVRNSRRNLKKGTQRG